MMGEFSVLTVLTDIIRTNCKDKLRRDGDRGIDSIKFVENYLIIRHVHPDSP